MDYLSCSGGLSKKTGPWPICLQYHLDKIEAGRTRIYLRLNTETLPLVQEEVPPRCNCPLNNTPITYNHFKGKNFILPCAIITVQNLKANSSLESFMCLIFSGSYSRSVDLRRESACWQWCYQCFTWSGTVEADRGFSWGECLVFKHDWIKDI